MDVSGAIVPHGADLLSLPGATNSNLLLDYPGEGCPSTGKMDATHPQGRGWHAHWKHKTRTCASLDNNPCIYVFLSVNILREFFLCLRSRVAVCVTCL